MKPDLSSSDFFNYKKFHSVVLFVVVDANYYFNYNEWNLMNENQTTQFLEFALFKMLKTHQANIPRSWPLPGTEEPSMPYNFIGDKACSLFDFVMRPYTGSFYL